MPVKSNTVKALSDDPRELPAYSIAEAAHYLRIPLATLRNWEQGRVLPDPAARSLLTIVARNPRAALRALAA